MYVSGTTQHQCHCLGPHNTNVIVWDYTTPMSVPGTTCSPWFVEDHLHAFLLGELEAGLLGQVGAGVDDELLEGGAGFQLRKHR